MPIRLVLAEDHYLVREGVRRLLEAQPGIEVAAVCGDLGSLLEAVDREAPDVVVTDVRMPPGHSDEGIQAARRLRETKPSVGVVVLSQYANPSYALADGGSLIDPKVVEGPVAVRARAATSPLRDLTTRERDVLRKMAEGRNNASIGQDLVVTERSVEKVINSIFMKLGLTWEPAVHKRVKAVILYLAESDRDYRDNGSQP